MQHRLYGALKLHGLQNIIIIIIIRIIFVLKRITIKHCIIKQRCALHKLCETRKQNYVFFL